MRAIAIYAGRRPLAALRAAWNVCSDIAGGNAVGQRFSNVLGRGIASHINTAIAVSQQAIMAFMRFQPGIAEFFFPRR